jgi:hypothetical protein
LQSTSSFYGFLPDGDLWVADKGFRPEIHDRLRRLQPGVLASLRRRDYTKALRMAFGVVEGLAHELRPAWANTLAWDEALMQALLVEVERCPLVARHDTTLRELRGTAVWVSHRAWSTSRSEALATAEQLASTLGFAAGIANRTVQLRGMDERAALWARAWV